MYKRDIKCIDTYVVVYSIQLSIKMEWYYSIWLLRNINFVAYDWCLLEILQQCSKPMNELHNKICKVYKKGL